MGNLTTHFSKSEFACSCCGLVRMDPLFMSRLEEARVISKYPYHITSGRRCHSHNTAINGAKTSPHMKGAAADISAPTSRGRYRILYGVFKAGFRRVGIGKNFIHVDSDWDKTGRLDNLVWTYYDK